MKSYPILKFLADLNLRRETRAGKVGDTRYILREHAFLNLFRNHPPTTTTQGYYTPTFFGHWGD
jgi:hypothetical protein